MPAEEAGCRTAALRHPAKPLEVTEEDAEDIDTLTLRAAKKSRAFPTC